jgi:hypothetical protein
MAAFGGSYHENDIYGLILGLIGIATLSRLDDRDRRRKRQPGLIFTVF